MLKITNGHIVKENEVLKGYDLIIENNRIIDICEGEKYLDAQVVDANEAYIMPGFIDIHSDMIESFIQPRSTAIMDFSLGLKEAEKQIALCGITTMYHSVSMFRDGTWDQKEIRKAKHVKRLAKIVKDINHNKHLIHHRYHLRYEIDNLECYNHIIEMLNKDMVHLISFMDHSPGQGQYKDLEIYRKHLRENITDSEFEGVLLNEIDKDKVSFEDLLRLVEIAKSKGIAISSHDDDTIEKLEVNRDLGIGISEFPITMDVAKKAKEMGFMTMVGAPNVLLGGSHSGNLSAAEAILNGYADILCSDYYPQSLLHGIFIMHKKYEKRLNEMVNLVTINPAKATGIDKDYGSIEIGKVADVLIVDGKGDYPTINSVFVNGQCILNTSYRL